MKIHSFVLAAAALSLAIAALAEPPDPAATPKFTGGTITGDAANGGPVGSVSSDEIRKGGFNSGGETGGSTAVVITPTPTPSATPRTTPKPTP